MKRIRWSSAAAADLEAIHDYLLKHHPSFANPTIKKLYEAACSLKQFPHRGRRGSQEGTREWVMAPLPYIIVYGVSEETVSIFRFLHTSENRPH